jgi:hypothetical protein
VGIVLMIAPSLAQVGVRPGKPTPRVLRLDLDPSQNVTRI